MTRRWLIYLSILLSSICQAVYSQGNNVQLAIVKCWHNTLASRLGLRNDQLQLYQGSATIGSTSEWLWNIFDSVVAKTDGYYYNPAQYNSFSSDYGLILYAMKEDHNQMDYKPKPDNQSCELNEAILKYESAGGKYIWNKTITDLVSKIDIAKPLKFTLDTTIVECFGYSNSIDGTCSGNKYSQLTIKLKIEAELNHVLVFYAYPYTKIDSLSPYLLKFKPWYSSCVLAMAYKNKNDSMAKSPNWDAVFRVKGLLQRACTALIIVDGVNTNFSVSSYTKFFVKNSDSHLSNNLKNGIPADISDNISFSTYSSVGTPVLLGVLVSSISDYINNDQ
jgi:hypothetical protein